MITPISLLMAMAFPPFFIPALEQPHIIEAKILTVTPDPKKFDHQTYELTISLLNKGADSIVAGDTIELTSVNNQEVYSITRYVVGPKGLQKDSNMLIKINGIYVDVFLIQTVSTGRRCGLYVKREESAKRKLYVASLDLSPFFPKRDPEPAVKLQDLFYTQQISQLDFRYCGAREDNMTWFITDNYGRRIAHGFLDVKQGIQSYTLMLGNLKAGRYTLSIGNGADEEDETFTVLR